ncbi:MAG: putative toxin-antitoxin system toxin component, PIN family [Lautropia sp.]|nr:putative toxin-antitoxin system toxin component, PIN family [Lautropia sp.]
MIDTNLWISRLLLPKSVSAQAVDKAIRWGRPLMSEETLAELARVLARPKFDRYVSREDRQQFLRKLGGVVTLVPIVQRVQVCRDPKDDKFLDLALAGQARYLLTGDHDLLVLNPFHSIRIITPADWLAQPV